MAASALNLERPALLAYAHYPRHDSNAGRFATFKDLEKLKEEHERMALESPTLQANAHQDATQTIGSTTVSTPVHAQQQTDTSQTVEVPKPRVTFLSSVRNSLKTVIDKLTVAKAKEQGDTNQAVDAPAAPRVTFLSSTRNSLKVIIGKLKKH
ncbi:hypothetical protein BDQ17DRAFT_1367586 [Cyathus striatus]|nr:hypothetical protein BDQ17DRAFT_1367586 [Cyathus striatus]